MTCFWDGIITSLFPNEKQLIGLKRPVWYEFVDILKQKNTKINKVKWNGKLLTNKEQEEFYIHIKDYNKETARRGYDCSVCDPFLALVCQIFELRIIHNYMGHKMIYECVTPKLKGEKIYSSNRGHFAFKTRKIL